MANWDSYIDQFSTEEQAFYLYKDATTKTDLIKTKAEEGLIYDYRHLVSLSNTSLIEKIQLRTDTTVNSADNIKQQFFAYIKSKIPASSGDESADWSSLADAYPLELQTAIQEIVNYEFDGIASTALTYSEFEGLLDTALADRYTDTAFADNSSINFWEEVANYFKSKAEILLDPWQALIASYLEDSDEQNAVAYFTEWFRNTQITNNSYEDFLALDVSGIEEKLKESFLNPYSTDTDIGSEVPSYALKITNYFDAQIKEYISQDESNLTAEELEINFLDVLRSDYSNSLSEQFSFLKSQNFITDFKSFTSTVKPDLYINITVNQNDASVSPAEEYDGVSYSNRWSFNIPASLSGENGKLIAVRPTFNSDYRAPKVGTLITDESGDTVAAKLVAAINSQKAAYESSIHAVQDSIAGKVNIFHNGELNGVDVDSTSPDITYPFFFFDIIPFTSTYHTNLANAIYTDALLYQNAGFQEFEKTIRLLQLDADNDDTNDLPFSSRTVRVSTVDSSSGTEEVTLLGDYTPNESGYIKVAYKCPLSAPESVTLRFELFDQENTDIPAENPEGDFSDADFGVLGVEFINDEGEPELPAFD